MTYSLPRRIAAGLWFSLLVTGLLLTVLAAPQPVRAVNLTASTTGDLINAINIANANGEDDLISIIGNITLTADLPAIANPNKITFEGNNHTIDGDHAHP